MAYIFKLPDVGEGMAEGEIVSWLVEVGDTVQEGDSIVEVQNDKSVEELASPVDGVVSKIIAEPGTLANVGDPLIEFETEDDGSDASEEIEDAPKDAQTPESPAAESEMQEDAAEGKDNSPVSSTDEGKSKRVFAIPSVRRYARENDIVLSQVTPSGQGGRVLKADIDKFLETGSTASTAEAPIQETATPIQKAATLETKKVAVQKTVQAFTSNLEDLEERVPMTMTRRAIARAMENSSLTIPSFTVFDEVNADKLMIHRKKFKEVAMESDIKLTYLAYIVKAIVSVLKKYPELNASLDETTNEIVYKRYYNIGIAVDTDKGLYVPVIKHANQKSVFQIAKEIVELAGKAHEGKLSADEMSDGTFSISNIGSVGGGWFTPIINHPEAAILGVGKISKKAIINNDGEVVPASMMELSGVYDHRIIDGATGQKAMNELKRLLADPELLLMEG